MVFDSEGTQQRNATSIFFILEQRLIMWHLSTKMPQTVTMDTYVITINLLVPAIRLLGVSEQASLQTRQTCIAMLLQFSFPFETAGDITVCSSLT